MLFSIKEAGQEGKSVFFHPSSFYPRCFCRELLRILAMPLEELCHSVSTMNLGR